MKIINLANVKQSEVIAKTISVLKNSGLVVYPTETVYGIGADATNQKAVNRLLQYKARREGKPLSVAVADLAMAKKYVRINRSALNLFKNFLPGPITVVCHGLHKVAAGVESEQRTLGLRLPDYPLVIEIVQSFGRPIIATSANASNQKRPYKIKDIFVPLSEKQKSLIDLVLDAGELPKREPSTVVDTTMDDYQILRQGDIQKDQLTRVKTLEIRSEEEAIQLGLNIISEYLLDLKDYCLIFALIGDLGTGKTQLAKGIAQGLEIKEPIVSPTFNLVREYNYQLEDQKGRLYHIDTWRLFDPVEIDRLGLDQMLKLGNVLVIEWANKVKNDKFQNPNVKIIEIKLEHISKNQRLLSFPN